jgi:hypothetical protein
LIPSFFALIIEVGRRFSYSAAAGSYAGANTTNEKAGILDPARSIGVSYRASCPCRHRSDLPGLRHGEYRKKGEIVNDYEVFELGDIALQEGATLRDAKLAYKTFGTLNENKSNAIIYPTWYSGFHWDNEWLIGEGMSLDPAKYFIIVPNMLGNGLSSSPSNTPPPHDQANFPNVTFYDQVETQHKLVTEHFGIETGATCGPVLRLLKNQRAQLRLSRRRKGGAH